MNTCHICSTPVEEEEDKCEGCGDVVCSNCSVNGLCLDCLSLLAFWEERK